MRGDLERVLQGPEEEEVKGKQFGDVAQLGERLVRNEKVGGSSPLISTKTYPYF